MKIDDKAFSLLTPIIAFSTDPEQPGGILWARRLIEAYEAIEAEPESPESVKAVIRDWVAKN